MVLEERTGKFQEPSLLLSGSGVRTPEDEFTRTPLPVAAKYPLSDLLAGCHRNVIGVSARAEHEPKWGCRRVQQPVPPVQCASGKVLGRFAVRLDDRLEIAFRALQTP
jgi:hypothetical protein